MSATVTRELRPYQVAALQSVIDGLEGGYNRLLWKKPTGTGKTFTFANLPIVLASWLGQFPENDRKMLVIAHREELLDQAAQTIAATNPGLIVMVEQANRHASPFADVIVASIQTLQAQKFARLRKLLRHCTPRVVVVDECHHAAAKSYRTALAHLGFLPTQAIADSAEIEATTHDDVEVMTRALAGWDQQAPRDRLLLGVTATPNRTDAVGLSCVFQSIAFSYDLKQAIADGWLVPITSWSVETKTSLDAVRTQRGDFNQRELADAVNNAARNQLALAAWREHAQGVATLGFTVDVQHAHDCKDLWCESGYRADAVSGETPREDRRIKLRQYQDGQIDALFNCMVLTEGTDLPRTGCILHLKPTKSASLYEQMTGRGLRLFPGKRECIVIDLVDLARKHSLQASPMLYGLPPSMLVNGKTLSEQADEFEKLMNEAQGFDVEEALKAGRMTLEQLGALARRVDVFWGVRPLGAFGEGRIVQWVKIDDTRYQVSYPWADGTETVQVVADLVGQWEVVATVKPSDPAQPRRQRTLATHCTTEHDAANMAEQFIQSQRQSILKLKAVDAPWMSRAVSRGQIEFLKKLGVTQVPKELTMGQASQWIDRLKASKGR
ncbi:MAG TPA: DEAD/DEAH box helicase [Sedimentisphaerales bacterium]|nr:DEAD/DEAH box helicase [Sedimentisphaerales bacterium]